MYIYIYEYNVFMYLRIHTYTTTHKVHSHTLPCCLCTFLSQVGRPDIFGENDTAPPFSDQSPDDAPPPMRLSRQVSKRTNVNIFTLITYTHMGLSLQGSVVDCTFICVYIHVYICIMHIFTLITCVCITHIHMGLSRQVSGGEPNE